MVDKLRMEGQVTDWEQFSNHLIVCGWNKKAEIIVRQYKAVDKNKDIPVVVIIAVSEANGVFQINPNDYRFKYQDYVIAIAQQEVKL